MFSKPLLRRPKKTFLRRGDSGIMETHKHDKGLLTGVPLQVFFNVLRESHVKPFLGAFVEPGGM